MLSIVELIIVIIIATIPSLAITIFDLNKDGKITEEEIREILEKIKKE